jgi:tetratricopeptide (TPR) repeat protein
MSGGGAFDNNGRLVAIHGWGDRYKKNTQTEVEQSNTLKSEMGSKIGYNRGIPIRWVVQSLSDLGILVGGRRPLSQVSVANTTAATTADEFFIAGFNKLVGEDGDFKVEKKEAIARFSRAIKLNPRYTIAYFLRAYVKYQINDSRGALADFNQAISLNPKLAAVYYNRGILKANKLNDRAGAIADFRTAAKLSRAQGQNQNLQTALEALRQLGATEAP